MSSKQFPGHYSIQLHNNKCQLKEYQVTCHYHDSVMLTNTYSTSNTKLQFLLKMILQKESDNYEPFVFALINDLNS